MSSGGPYQVGQRFGSYELEAYLGSGAFKSVYRAKNSGSVAPGEVVALGFPHQQDPDGIEAVRQECTVAARLDHPNILRVHGLEQAGGVAFLVMEYMDGRTLRQALRDDGPLDAVKAVRYAGLIADALSHAHAAHAFHRDVKPDNIFITSGDVPKLFDFGVGRLLERTGQIASTRVGTVEYMAPEMMQGSGGMNADLWALGITLYEALTGQRPFTGEMGEVVQKILTTPHDEAPLREKHVDTRVIRIIRKLLRKDPEDRYRTAEDLVRDLEVVARGARIVHDDEGRLEVLIRASYPLISVISYEEDRVIAAVRSIAARLAEDSRRPRPVYVWSASQGLMDAAGGLLKGDSIDDPTAALVHAIENAEDALYVFLDAHRHFTPVTSRLIRDAARAVRMSGKSVLFVSPGFQFPEELEKEVSMVFFHPPDREQLEGLLTRARQKCLDVGLAVELDAAGADSLLHALAGLTEREAERSLWRAIVRTGGLKEGVDRFVAEDKTQAIRKNGILEYYHTSESFADVGGLENLLSWFRSRAAAFSGRARFAGLQQPRGVMLVGVPGCGKSLSARALAGAWGVPLVRLDVGRIFGSLVGASEANLRRALVTVEAVSPCILWIDEIEKGFAGVQSGSGGGVTARVFGGFLTWLQESRAPVFVVATANDLLGLPPELKGRLDEVFFVGLPSRSQREGILRIHLQRRRRDPSNFDVPKLAELAGGFSGAELEQAFVEGMSAAFAEDREVETRDIGTAIQSTYPLSRSRAREISALEAWARVNARPANAVPAGAL